MATTILYLNDWCNQHCIFCCTLGRYRKMSKRKYSRMISKAEGRVILSGGEAPLAQSLHDVLQAIKANAQIRDVELQSNGAVFSNPRLIDSIAREAVVTQYNINFPSFTQLDDVKLTGSRLFRKRIAGIKGLLMHGLDVRLTFVIVKHNYRMMRDYLQYVHSTFGKGLEVQFSFVQLQGGAKARDIMPRYSEIKPCLVEALGYAHKEGMRCTTDNIPLCVAYPFVKNSIDYRKAKAREKSFHPKMHLAVCRDCRMLDKCYGVPLDYIRRYGALSPLTRLLSFVSMAAAANYVACDGISPLAESNKSIK